MSSWDCILPTRPDQQARAVGNAVQESAQARKALKIKSYRACVDHATKALEVGPNSIELREVRLTCAEQLGDIDAVYGDLRYVFRLIELISAV